MAIDHATAGNGHPMTAYPESAIAIVGAACRFAGADCLEGLWRMLETGASHCVDIPKDRFPDSRFERRRFKKNFRAHVMDDVDSFDHKFFNVAAREASFRDPQQRLALEVTYQALESAGYFAREMIENQRDMGCYIATAGNEYRENVITHTPSAFSLTGSIRPFIAGQISHHFGFTGPAIVLDAACAGSGVAINIACRAVASGECRSAIAGAANIFVSPDTFQDLARGHFTSTTGPSRPFDAAADGYGRGEGVAVVVLKRLADAIRDGDVIKGVILATATNQCANESSITVPHGPSQSSLYRKALRLARLNASDIGYVEAHGTGTRVGDPIEAESIRTVFGTPDGGPADKTYMGSIKSNVGHTEASAGLSGLIKVMLMIEKASIPKQALFTNLNTDIPSLGSHCLEIPETNVSWNSASRVGCVNSYGASGCNAVMILAQPPMITTDKPAPQVNAYPISITAFSQSSLKTYCSALLKFMDRSDANDDFALDVAFHSSRRRNPELPFSVTASVSNLHGFRDLLVSALSGSTRRVEYKKRPTVLFFAGQDGTPASVPRELYDSCAIFRKHLDDCEAAILALGCDSMFPTIFMADPPETSILAHAKLFSVQYASAKAWIDCHLQPARLIGHSFGQLTALCVSGALSLQDALHLVTRRASLIDTVWGSDTGSMMAIEATQDELAQILVRNPTLETACYNGVRSFVLAGPSSSIDSLEAFFKASPKSHRFKRLHVPNAFHTNLAKPLVEPLRRIVEGLDLQNPVIPIETCSETDTWSSIDPLAVASQIREPVYFYQAVQRVVERLGPCVWIEASPGNNKSLLLRALQPWAPDHVVRSTTLNSLSSLSHLSELTVDLWNLNIKVQFWPFHHSQQHHHRTLNLPPYQFDKTRHWIEWQESGSLVATKDTSPPQPESLIRILRETTGGCEFEVDTQFESWRTNCVESVDLGVSVCPISLLLEILSEAIGITQRTAVQRLQVHCVRHMRMLALILADTSDNLRLNISKADSPQTWTFRLTRTSDSHRELASGTICTGDARFQSEFNTFQRLIDTALILNIERDPVSDCIRGRGVYRNSDRLFRVPKSRQVIRAISVRGNEATASLTSLFGNSCLNIETLIYIPLVCLNSIYECSDDHLFHNTAIGYARLSSFTTSPTDEAASYSVYLKFFGLEGPEVTCDIYALNSHSGQISAVFLDVGFARISKKSLHHALSHSATPLPQKPVSYDTGSSANLAPDMQHMPINLNSKPGLDDDRPKYLDGRLDLNQILLDTLARITDVNTDKVDQTTQISDLGIDSLMWIDVAEEINKVFGTNVGMTDFMLAEDVGALCRLITSRTTAYSHSSEIKPLSISSTDSGSRPFSSDIQNFEKSPSHEPRRNICTNRTANLSVLDNAFKAFEEIRTDFEALAREAGCDRFWSEIYPVQMRLIEAYIIEAFTKLGCDLSLLEEGEEVSIISFEPRRDKLLKRLMLVLCDSGLVTQSDKRWLRTEKPVLDEMPSPELFDQIQVQYPKWAPEHQLLHLAGSNLACHLDGTQDPLQLLFGSPEKRQLMADQYRVAPFQSTMSRQLANFIKRCFNSQALDEPIQILEIGGGTCGTTVYALDALVEAGIPVEYTFTDISPSFIAAAKSKLKHYSFVKYRTLDVSKVPPPEITSRYDLILATNVIHATRNADESARHVRQMLRAGGFFVMTEYTRIYAAIDVIFGQLEGWWLFDDGRTHAIMNELEWEATLQRAGYRRIRWTGLDSRESEVSRMFIAS